MLYYGQNSGKNTMYHSICDKIQTESLLINLEFPLFHTFLRTMKKKCQSVSKIAYLVYVFFSFLNKHVFLYYMSLKY